METEVASLEFRPLPLHGAWEIRTTPRSDARGYFVRTYDADLFRQRGLQTQWLQENQSLSTQAGTIRGLHFQAPPFAETKLVRVVRGKVLDVLVDLRTSSPTYGKWASLELADDNFSMAYIPKGFAHGFCTCTDDCIVVYRVDAPYRREAEGGLPWNDPGIRIDWPISNPVLSERDGHHTPLARFHSPF